MAASSVTLGLVSDKLGRLQCIRIGFYLSLVATALAIVAHNYLLLNVCVFIMSYAQVGAANALCTLLLEATSPRYRIVAVFEYCFGWGIGIVLVPAINELTLDYKWFLGALLALQLLMLPWLHMGIFESIRWLLSEGHLERAQVELSRACRINGVHMATHKGDCDAVATGQQLSDSAKQELIKQEINQLALRYSKTMEQQTDSDDRCFLLRMFDRRLWKETIILTLTSIMIETAYFGMIQANKFVGSSVNLNYLVNGASHWASAVVSTLMMIILTRRMALIAPVLVASLCCLGMALSYHYLTVSSEADSGAPLAYSGANSTQEQSDSPSADEQFWRRLDRDSVNFYIMNLGRFMMSIASQVSTVMHFEAYPSNLRQTAHGSLIFIGRCGSIVAPFLFNDTSADKWLLQVTLLAVAAIGLLVSILAPIILRDHKNEELHDHLEEIEL